MSKQASSASVLMADVAARLKTSARQLRDRYPGVGITVAGRRRITEAEAAMIVAEESDTVNDRFKFTVSVAELALRLGISVHLTLKRHRRHAVLMHGRYWWTETYASEVEPLADTTSFTVSKAAASETLGVTAAVTAKLLYGKGVIVGKKRFYRPEDVAAARVHLDNETLLSLSELSERFHVTENQLVYLLCGERAAGMNSGARTARFRRDLPDALLPPSVMRRRGARGWRAGDVLPWLSAVLNDLDGYLTPFCADYFADMGRAHRRSAKAAGM